MSSPKILKGVLIIITSVVWRTTVFHNNLQQIFLSNSLPLICILTLFYDHFAPFRTAAAICNIPMNKCS